MRLLIAGTDRSAVALGGSLPSVAVATPGRAVSLPVQLTGLALLAISRATGEDLE